MNILLFGASGRLGGAFCRGLVDHTLITPSHHDVDLSNEDSLHMFLESVSIDLIINTTAYNKVDAAETLEGWKEAEELNVFIPERLAKFATSRSIPFIHFSTDYVFDGEKPEGYVESDAPNPINAYGRSKYDGELAVMRAHPDATIIRVSRLYGPAAESSNAKKDFIEIVKEKAAQDSTITFFDKEFGSPTCVDDVVEQVKNHLLPNPIAGVFHMTNAGGATWYDWAKEIVADLHLPVVVEKRTDTPTRAARIPQSTMLISTKLPPMRSWQEALRHYLASMSSRAND